MAHSFVVIPARLNSTRLPGKMLLNETGKSVLQHTYEAALQARRPAGIVIATDHERIADEVDRFGGHAVMTDPEAPSGTDRVIEIAEQRDDVDIFVNVQGDEPELPPEYIDLAVELLEQRPDAAASTLVAPLRKRAEVESPEWVKVVFDDQQRALYFSRSPVPHVRELDDERLRCDPPVYWQHMGLYAYRRDFLLRFKSQPVSPLEAHEKLEQLRVLSAGETMVVGCVHEPTVGIDRWQNYRDFVDRWAARHGAPPQGPMHANSSAS